MVSGFFDNCRKAVIISSRTEVGESKNNLVLFFAAETTQSKERKKRGYRATQRDYATVAGHDERRP